MKDKMFEIISSFINFCLENLFRRHKNDKNNCELFKFSKKKKKIIPRSVCRNGSGQIHSASQNYNHVILISIETHLLPHKYIIHITSTLLIHQSYKTYTAVIIIIVILKIHSYINTLFSIYSHTSLINHIN
jgi:hypothetical protein